MDFIYDMFRDVTLMNEDMEILKFARELGYSKIYFKEEIRNFNMVFIENYEKKRKAVENSNIKILLNPHLVSKKDSLHFRNSGLDQVLCKSMNKNEISLGISLDKIRNFIDIGRVKQNIKLCRKYKVKILFFSYAENKYQLRNVKDLISFLEILGMTPGEAKVALSEI